MADDVTENAPPRGRVLIVDDELPIPDEQVDFADMPYMWYYSEALRDNGFEVVEKDNVDDALETIRGRAGDFVLIILDIMMPPGAAFAEEDTLQGIFTGVYFAEQVARIAPGTRVVVLTNNGDHAKVNGLKENRTVLDVLNKYDFTPNDLVAKVVGLVEGAEGWRQPRP